MDRNVILLIFVVSGALNVLLMKSLNVMTGECSDGRWRSFQHPVLLTALMFFGEFLCFVLFKCVKYFLKRRGDGSESTTLITRGEHEFSSMILLFPAFCDAVASMMLFSGLYLTFATSFQMLRAENLWYLYVITGISIIFVGIFGSIYLNQTLSSRHWIAMFTIICGAITLVSVDVQRVIYDDTTLPNADANAVLTGDLLIIFAQVFHAAQFVYEEKYVKDIDIPALQACGLQGIYGLLMAAVLGAVMHFLQAGMPFGNNSNGVFDDLSDLIPQIRSNLWFILVLSIFVVSTACYNFTALSIVKFSSAANRVFADGLRLLFIWLGAFLLEWELANMGSLLAFLILAMGTIAYRNAIFVEWYRSLLASLARRRYINISVDTGNVTISQPADII